MNKTTSRRTITVSALVLAAMAILANIKRTGGLPPIRMWVGYGAVYTMLSIIDDLGSSIGAGFAILAMISGAIYYGEDAFGLVAERSAGTPPTPAGRSASGPAAITGSDVPPLSPTPPDPNDTSTATGLPPGLFPPLSITPPR